MTPDLDAIVARHIDDPYTRAGCMRCGDPWPCDARQWADALTAAEAVGEDWYQQFIRAASKADAAEADADALAEHLRAAIHDLISDWEPNGPQMRYEAAAAALAAHDARREP